MDMSYACYCGLCCLNCSVQVKINPVAKSLYSEMCKAGYEKIIDKLQNGAEFWAFLKNMAECGSCVTCKDETGNLECKVRDCAKEKNLTFCAFCDDYPCARLDVYFDTYPLLAQDNALLREKGVEEWIALQEKRQKEGFTHNDKP